MDVRIVLKFKILKNIYIYIYTHIYVYTHTHTYAGPDKIIWVTWGDWLHNKLARFH